MFAELLKRQSAGRAGRARAQVHTLPAPVGGWNARDALSAMKPEDAIILDNIIPDQGRVRLRPGYVAWATAIAGDHVESLMEYAPPDSGNNKLFGASPSAIYDVTLAAANPAAAVSSLSNARWQHLMFAALGGNYLCCVNGADNYRTFNGTAWTDQGAAVTGATSSSFVGIAAHASRLWFVEENTLDAWYLPTGAITGAATKFPLGPLCKRGGKLLAIGSWTSDGGDGMNDRWVGVTTRGEVIVYSGTDPATADTWQLVGVFTVAEPVGRRCIIKVGGDVGIITSTGVALLSQMIGANKSGQRKVTITNKIARAFVEAYDTAGTAHGWQIVEYPKQNLVIVNVPVRERAEAVQFVINVETGGWCRWTGLNANCWSLLGDDIYFGTSDGRVCQFGKALSDDGEPIPWTVQSAFNKCGSPLSKVFRAARPLMLATPGYRPAVEIKVDYDTRRPLISPPLQAISTSGSFWDTFDWDTVEWSTESEKVSVWQTITGSGRAMSLCLVGSGAEVVFEFNEVDILYEAGGWL